MSSDSDIRDTTRVMQYIQENIDSLSKRAGNLEQIAATPQSLSAFITPVLSYNTNTEVFLRSIILPGKSLLTSNLVEIFALGKAVNISGGAVNFTWRLYYGATAIVLGPVSIPASGPANGRLFTLRGFLRPSGGSPQAQELTGHLLISNNHNVFTTANPIDGWITATLGEDSDSDQDIRLSITHGTAALNIGTELSILRVGYPQTAA